MLYLVLSGALSILFLIIALYFAVRGNKQPKDAPNIKPNHAIYQWVSVLLCLICLIMFGSCLVWYQQGLI